MNNLEFNQIKSICIQTRQDIINGVIEFPGSTEFPTGCCGNASQDYLLPWLENAGFRNVVYVNGMHPKYQSHGWLEYNGYIIDITADQFKEENLGPVIIIRKEASLFHQQFK
jgi:hypothetical protein